ncbi:MAG: hypothetical protein AAGU10_12660 [Methanosarcina mazei]
MCLARIVPRPNCASGSQEIGDFLGVALQVQQHEVYFTRFARSTTGKREKSLIEKACKD